MSQAHEEKALGRMSPDPEEAVRKHTEILEGMIRDKMKILQLRPA